MTLGQKGKSMQKLRKAGRVIMLFGAMMMLSPEVQAFAAPTTLATAQMPDLTNFQPLMILRIIYVLFLSIVAIMGGIQVAKSVQEWSTAMQQNDSVGASTALKGIVGGAIQAFVSGLMGIFGIVI